MIKQWAKKWGVSSLALHELRELMGAVETVSIGIGSTRSEAAIQNLVRLEASRKGYKLARNNVGVLRDDRGIPVRFGLFNDSKTLNQTIKSSDLIGISPDGQFVAREVKHEGWKYTGNKHEQAQLKFIEMINAMGGDAKFVTGEGSFD